MFTATRGAYQMFVVMLMSFFYKTSNSIAYARASHAQDFNHCLSWRVAVEANNVRAWRTVPTQCLRYVENYMMCGQYEQDLEMVVQQIYDYLENITLGNDGMDAWILDVDDTCLSNLIYYKQRRFGGDPYDPISFKIWARKASCAAIPAILDLFKMLIQRGFKVFLLTGRDEETLGQPTIENLYHHGFIGYEKLILRDPTYRGKSAAVFKYEKRKELEQEGYRIWGNVGDQWSDLSGQSLGERSFKLPNPMYFVP